MDYEKYFKKAKEALKKLTMPQKIGIALVTVFIVVVVVVLLDPLKKMLEMRNSQRRSDVVNILNSVYQYSLENDGQLPFSLTTEPIMICKSKAQSCEGLADLSRITADKKYLLSSVPVDPKMKDANSSGYQIVKLSNGRISVSAPFAESSTVISLSK